MTDKKENCGACRYWERYGNDLGLTGRATVEETGLCHRFPPVATAASSFSFPMLGCGTWCGEFKARVRSNKNDK